MARTDHTVPDGHVAARLFVSCRDLSTKGIHKRIASVPGDFDILDDGHIDPRSILTYVYWVQMRVENVLKNKAIILQIPWAKLRVVKKRRLVFAQ